MTITRRRCIVIHCVLTNLAKQLCDAISFPRCTAIGHAAQLKGHTYRGQCIKFADTGRAPRKIEWSGWTKFPPFCITTLLYIYCLAQYVLGVPVEKCSAARDDSFITMNKCMHQSFTYDIMSHIIQS